MHKSLFFAMNVLGTLTLGHYLLTWWVSLYEAELVSPPIAATVVILGMLLALVQIIYIGIAISEESG